MATKIVNHKRKHNKLIDRVAVDGGELHIDEYDELNLPAGMLKDGLYPVYRDGYKITIDFTPFAEGFIPSEESYEAWLKEVMKMRRKTAK